MKTMKWVYTLLILLAITAFNFSAERLEAIGRTEPKLNSKPPIITHSFAVEKGYYGSTWKFYIEAEDPDGDMSKIVVTARQPGYGYYTNLLPITVKPQFRKHLIGYIQWNSMSSKAANIREWTQVTLRVSVVDKAGNESNEVVFPITFESGVKSLNTLPAPFDNGKMQRLGYLHLDLVDNSYSNEDRREF
jgi:hypothetical protein